MTNKLLETLTLAEETLSDIVRVFKFDTGSPVEALAAIREQKAELEKQRDGAVAQKCFGAGAAWPGQDAMKKAAYELSKWLSAALDDPKVCKDYKKAINDWYSAAMPFIPTEPKKQAEQEPVGFFFPPTQEREWWEQAGCDDHPEAVALYAAPVRAKDLTDSEIADIGTNCGTSMWSLMFARAVIAADREKNRV